MTTTIEFCIFRFSLGMKFHFEQTILNFWTRYAQKRYLRSKPKILHIQISLGTKFQFKQKTLIFCIKLAKKSETDSMNCVIEFCISKLVQVLNFSLNKQLQFYGLNMPKNGISSLKQIKLTAPLNFACSNQPSYQVSV